MNDKQRDMDLRTRYLARLIGIFFLVFTAAFYLHPDYTKLLTDSGTLLVLGIAWLVAGTAIVLGHNRWRGSALALAVTLVAWLMALRGAAILLASPEVVASTLTHMRFAERSNLYFALDLAVGLYFVLAGFLTRTAQAN